MCARLTAITALSTLVILWEFEVAHTGFQHISEIMLLCINNTISLFSVVHDDS